ncbi:hypothetical protein Aph01nite_42240 [Acrocarpospora phusangensis]|uniref:Uncharacterized protein n=1 Tax=Acrocarpospora phusangensis TaxID=1070424 RepID=A0A919QDW0_9ACTN|nr:hypothetical protein [Acrocarpospora phusangensis]GIH25914.1 hypothetical protein Aph01nite_42240 [Acrocarpospora phusangensis]
MTEIDPEKAPAEPLTAGKVGARRAEMGQELPDSVSLSLNVPQVRPAATTRPEAARPSTADPSDAMLVWPPIEPEPRPHLADDTAENARRADAAPPVNDVVRPGHSSHSSPDPVAEDTVPNPNPNPEPETRKQKRHRTRYVFAAAAGLAVARVLVKRRKKARR